MGADGSTSIVRKFLAPTTHELHRLPINAVGCALTMSEEQVNYFKDHVDPLYFMGTHPETDTFVFWSLLDTPTAPGQPYRAQVYFSWVASDADEELLKQPLLDVFKQKGRPFFPRMGDMVEALPEDTVVTKVNLVDWPSVEWDNWNGTCTLIGDAAHCMVICKYTVYSFASMRSRTNLSRSRRGSQPCHCGRLSTRGCYQVSYRWPHVI